jgi:acyl-CoA synthetase (AMP-forming)/AMP-acid ligase II
MLISGGFNIYPHEIEAVLTNCPGIIEAAVIGRSDPDWGEVAVAFVSLANGSAMTAIDIAASVKPRLGIKTPKRIHVLAELPKTSNGKVDKKALRDLADCEKTA